MKETVLFLSRLFQHFEKIEWKKTFWENRVKKHESGILIKIIYGRSLFYI